MGPACYGVNPPKHMADSILLVDQLDDLLHTLDQLTTTTPLCAQDVLRIKAEINRFKEDRLVRLLELLSMIKDKQIPEDNRFIQGEGPSGPAQSQ